MPRDLMPDEGHLVIHDRAGARLPFSQGVMATSLLSAGLATSDAYRLAMLLYEELLAGGTREIKADELVERADALLTAQAGSAVALRWRAWLHVKRVQRPIVVAISGAPGVGKSTIATRLAVRLDINHIVTTDTIREVLRTVIPPAVLPELHASSFELVQQETALPFSGFDRQSGAVGAATNAVVARLCTEHRRSIIEGIHAAPGFLSRTISGHPTKPIVIERLMVEPNIELHRQRLAHRSHAEPLRRGDRALAEFSTIRAIQAHLSEQAEANGVTVVDSSGLGELTQSIVDEVVSSSGDDDDVT